MVFVVVAKQVSAKTDLVFGWFSSLLQHLEHLWRSFSGREGMKSNEPLAISVCVVSYVNIASWWGRGGDNVLD